MLYEVITRLSSLITSAIGEGWEADLERLEELRPFAEDAGFQADFMAAKRANKVDLAKLIDEIDHFTVDPDALFDTQVKRIHEYKRQLLNILHVIHLYDRLKRGEAADWTSYNFV